MRRITLVLIVLGIFLVVLTLGALLVISPDLDWWASSGKIGVIEVNGVLTDAQDHLRDLKELRRQKSIKAILLRINSPGGGVGPSQELYREVRRTVAQKPVVASLGGVAASGGYYIASAATRIVANPGTLTGSIGVVFPFHNLEKLFDKVGYEEVLIKSGKFKDLGNPGREMTPEEKALLQETVDAVHRQFVEAVAEGRGLSMDQVKAVADGRILTGERAYELSLVDRIGNFEDAVIFAAELAGIEGDPEVVYMEKEGFSLLGWLLGGQWMKRLHSFWGESVHLLHYQMPVSLK